MIEKSSKSRDIVAAKMFDHLITDTCGATGFSIRKFKDCLKNFIGSNRSGKWSIPVNINVGK